MPASSSDLISLALQNSFSKESRDYSSGLEEQFHGSSQIGVKTIDYVTSKSNDPLILYIKNQYGSLKKVKTNIGLNKNRLQKSEVHKMAHCKTEDKLEEPRVTLWAPDKVTLGWRKTFPPGAGMMNLGNTCYMNSSLQALFHIPSVANWLLEEFSTHIPSCEANTQNASFCSICGMMKTLKQSLDRGNGVLKPTSIHNKLKCIGKTLMYGRQEDAHEFIKMLLDHMEKSFLQFKRATRLDHRSKETTPLNQIFGGYLRQQVICPLCCYVSTTFSHFQDLVLDIRAVGSVDDALSLYFKKETLDSDNAYKCEKCHKKVPATKRHLIEKAPHVLLLQLKRFTISGGKITKHVNIQKTIDISRYVNGVKPSLPNGTGQYLYRLVSMVIHIGGSQHGGHYTAVAEASNNTMFEFDDSNVRPISVQTALLKNPYILFYEMVRKPKGSSVPKQVIRQSSEKTLLRQSSNDKISKPLPTSLSTSCMWNGVSSNSTSDDIGETVERNSIVHSKKSPLLSHRQREKISFGIKSHAAFNKGQEENKFNKQNALGLHNGALSKRSFQVTSTLTKPFVNGKNFAHSIVPYNAESEDSEDDRDTAKLMNGHSKTNDKSIEKGLHLNGESTKCTKNLNNDLSTRKINTEKIVNNSDKTKDDDVKSESKSMNDSSQGSLHINGRAPSFLPRIVQAHSSNGGQSSGNQLNGHSKLSNGVHSDKTHNKNSNENEKLSNGVSNHKNSNGSINLNGNTGAKSKENGWTTEFSERSPSELSSCSSTSSQGFIAAAEKLKSKAKAEKTLKDRDSFNGWTTPSNIQKSELEKSHSQDSVLITKNQHADKCETASVKSKESLDSNRSDKSARSMKKSLFSLFPCVSSTHSPDFSPEEEQLNSVIENKSASPVRTDPKPIPNNQSHHVEKQGIISSNKENNDSEEDEESDDGEHDTDDDDDNFQSKRNRDADDHEPRSPSKKCKPESKRQIKKASLVNGDKTMLNDTDISERLQNSQNGQDGEDSEEKSSKSKHQKNSKNSPEFLSQSCDENKSERNFSARDEENFSMEEKKSRHKKKHKNKSNPSLLFSDSLSEESSVTCQSKSKMNINVEPVAWNRHVRDLSDTLPGNKYNKAKSEDVMMANGCWKNTNDLSVVNALKTAGELTFGVEVKTWEGEESLLDKETRKDRNEAKKRSCDDMYNEDYDTGKIRKKRFKSSFSDVPDRRDKNPFQKFQNEFINSNDKNTFNNRNHFRSNSYSSNSNVNGSNSYSFHKNKFNNYRSHTWDSRSPSFSSQNHFRNGSNNYNRNKPRNWFQKNRNNRGKYGREREKFGGSRGEFRH